MKIFNIGSVIEAMASPERLRVVRVVYIPIGGREIGLRPSACGVDWPRDLNLDAALIDLLSKVGVDLSAIAEEMHFPISLKPVR